MSGLTEAWSMAQKQVQKAQKKQYDKNTKEPDLKVGERVFVYMPKEKATKAYKFARPFHGPFRVVEVLDAGVVVRLVDPWRGESIRVAVNRVRRCPEAVPEGESWPARKPARKAPGKRTSSKKVDSSESKLEPRPHSVWKGRLRGTV